MNLIFFAMIAIAFLAAAWQQLWWTPTSLEEQQALIEAAEAAGQAAPTFDSPMQELTIGALTSAAGAVDIAISLIGGMALFLGVMKVAEAGGMLKILAKLLRPLMVWLFPDVPPNHPAMGAMILNIAANALGLGNAATPFGIRAMVELDKLNPEKGTATNAMALFLAINTSAVTLLPTGVMVIRERMGSVDPGGIFATTLIATVCSTTAGILAAKLLQRVVAPVRGTVAEVTATDPGSGPPTDPELLAMADEAYPMWVSLLALGGVLLLIVASVLYGRQMAPWIIPLIIFGMLSFGFFRGVKVYEKLVEGAKDGFNIAVMIIPYLVAILVAVGMLKKSGALDAFVALIGPFTSLIGLPAEALPMALMRPLSGSGASGIMMATMQEYGTDTYTGYLVSTLQGSTETTFYVLAVYFGAVNVNRIRHTLVAALTADTVGVLAAVGACLWLYGHLW